jgi:hypothetical protein
MNAVLCWLRRPNFGQRRIFRVTLLIAVAASTNATAQPAANQQQGNFGNVLFPGNGQGQGQNGLLGGPNATTTGRQGASANADFDSLIDLIQSTVETASWAENGGGEAEIRPFPGGVLVDATGTLKLRTHDVASRQLSAKRGSVPSTRATAAFDAAETADAVRTTSDLRFVSLPRLEREIARRQAASEPLEPAMLTLAGLTRVQYVFVYPESGDLVLAGPAGDWRIEDGRIVSARSGQPVVRLDDLLVLLRRGDEAAQGHFGCSINPRQEALAKTQAFLASSSQRTLQPSQRKKWLGDLRDTVGKQDIEIFGIDPECRVAGVLVEADYHMKLIGMGLAEGVDGVDSYLDSVEQADQRAGASPPPMSVLRWWFALNYKSIESSLDRNAFELIGQGVRVLSENEMLAAQGRRVHTGQSDPLNRQFAENFTDHFAELAAKYPVYGELRNIFDLAMAVALIEHEDLAERAQWSPTTFASSDKLPLPPSPVPRQVETVINHRVVNRTQIIAGVSGGVMVAPEDVLREVHANDRAQLDDKRTASRPKESSAGTWWWDAK